MRGFFTCLVDSRLTGGPSINWNPGVVVSACLLIPFFCNNQKKNYLMLTSSAWYAHASHPLLG